MKKRAFVPAADCLESRIALSGVAMFIGGLPVLSVHALQPDFSAVNKAFTTFATKGQNYNLLTTNLAKSLMRIPFQVRDGLQAAVLAVTRLPAKRHRERGRQSRQNRVRNHDR